MSNEAETRQLVISIIDFLRSQLNSRQDFAIEDHDGLQIAIECLELAYGLESSDPRQRRNRRPLLDMFNQVVNPTTVKNKQQAEMLKNEGNEKMLQELFEEAADSYTQAIDLDRWNAIYYCNRAGAYIALRRYYDAIADCREALSLNPDYAKALGRMGQAYALLERPRQAANCYRQALELEPDNERYQNNLRVAENLANTTSPGQEFFTHLFNSLFGNTDESTNPRTPTRTLTIIEVAPVTNDSSENTEEQSSVERSERDQNDINDTNTDESPQRGPNLLQFALPFILGLIQGESDSTHHTSDENSENYSVEPSETFNSSNPDEQQYLIPAINSDENRMHDYSVYNATDFQSADANNNLEIHDQQQLNSDRGITQTGDGVENISQNYGNSTNSDQQLQTNLALNQPAEEDLASSENSRQNKNSHTSNESGYADDI